MRKNFAIILTLVLALMIPVTFALTGSLDNARMILRVDIPDGQMAVIHKSLKVNNINDVVIKVEFQPDYGLDTITTFYNKTLYLQPGESDYSYFDINLLSGGNYSGKVLIKFSTADPSQKSPPVGLASTVTIIANGTVNKNYQDYRDYVNTEKNASPKLPPPPANVTKEVIPSNPDRENGTATVGIGTRFPSNYDPQTGEVIEENTTGVASTSTSGTTGNKNNKKTASADKMLLIGLAVVVVMILILGTLFVLVVKKKRMKKGKKA